MPQIELWNYQQKVEYLLEAVETLNEALTKLNVDIAELNEIIENLPGDSALFVEIDMAGGTLSSDVLEAVLAKPYNVVFTLESENGTVYMKPIMVSPSQTDLHFEFDTQGQMNISLNFTTGEYRFIMN